MQKIKLNIQRFASGTINQTSSTSNKASVRLLWESSIISGENASNVTVTAQILRSSSGTTACTFQGPIVIDGTSSTIKQYRSNWTTSWKTVGTFTKRVEHNADGAKSITVSATISTEDDATSLTGTYKASGTITLDSINRGSVLNSISNFKLTDTVTLGITKYVTNATDNLVISIGNTTIKTINGVSNGDTFTFSSLEQTAIKNLMTSPQKEITFALSTVYNESTIGTSIQSAIVTSLDKPVYRNIVLKANGHYQTAINGVVNEDIDSPFQVYSDDGAMIFGDTGWQEYLWKNSSYDDVSYQTDEWRVINGILYAKICAGKDSTIDSSSEIEIARIPIIGNTSFSSNDSRLWISAVGYNGAVAGFIMIQNQDYISIYLKPHTSSNAYAGKWYAGMFVVPLDDTAQINLSQLEVNE